jgi:hypothetical protein
VRRLLFRFRRANRWAPVNLVSLRVTISVFTRKEGKVMFRAFFVAALLTGSLWVSGCVSVAMASEAADASNIGFVLYTKSHAPGTLNSAVGVGMDIGNGLAVGWRRIAD